MYIQENLARGFIWCSTFPGGAPVLLNKNKDGTLCTFIDYRALNQVKVWNWYLLPLISEVLDHVWSARIFTELNLQRAYNLVGVRAGDVWKNAFWTCYRHFDYLVMPFYLTNAPMTLQRQLRWALLFSWLDFIIIYHLGSRNGKANVLSWKGNTIKRVRSLTTNCTVS